MESDKGYVKRIVWSRIFTIVFILLGWVVRFKERFGIKSDPTPKEPKTSELSNAQLALEAAEHLLEYINNRDFLLKDVITVRMIRDRIASEQDCQSSDY